MTSAEITSILKTAQSATNQMDAAHLKELKSILLSTQPSERCVFFKFLSLKHSVKFLINQLLKSDDAINTFNYKQIKWIYKLLGDYNYYPRCALCNQIIDISSATVSKRRQADSPLSFSWDHIHPKSHGGSSSLRNLQPTHKVCNNKKADNESYNMPQNINIKINIQLGNNCISTKYKTLRPRVNTTVRVR